MKRTIPSYVYELMEKAELCYRRQKGWQEFAVGYTLRISKPEHRNRVTFLREIDRLVWWANSQYVGSGFVLYIPNKTQCEDEQYAIVTIYDPVMMRIEHLIKKQHGG